jgi:hypothetical protein
MRGPLERCLACEADAVGTAVLHLVFDLGQQRPTARQPTHLATPACAKKQVANIEQRVKWVRDDDSPLRATASQARQRSTASLLHQFLRIQRL